MKFPSEFEKILLVSKLSKTGLFTFTKVLNQL